MARKTTRPAGRTATPPEPQGISVETVIDLAYRH